MKRTTRFLPSEGVSHMSISGCKVFSATKARDRADLDDRVNDWLADNSNLTVVDTVITLSSDAEFHCLTIILFYSREK